MIKKYIESIVTKSLRQNVPFKMKEREWDSIRNYVSLDNTTIDTKECLLEVERYLKKELSLSDKDEIRFALNPVSYSKLRYIVTKEYSDRLNIEFGDDIELSSMTFYLDTEIFPFGEYTYPEINEVLHKTHSLYLREWRGPYFC